MELKGVPGAFGSTHSLERGASSRAGRVDFEAGLADSLAGRLVRVPLNLTDRDLGPPHCLEHYTVHRCKPRRRSNFDIAFRWVRKNSSKRTPYSK